MLMGLVIAFVYLAGMPRGTGVLIMSSVLGFDLLVESARLRIPAFNEKVMRICGPIMRHNEVSRFSGTPYYIMSAILAVGIFPKPVAILSVLYLALGDPAASLVGILYGKDSLRIAEGKSLIGSAAGVITCALVTFVYLMSLGISDGSVIVLSVVGGLAGGLAELLPFDLDDNFTIPVISGFVLWLAFIILGI
jgi:dolichol kinase